MSMIPIILHLSDLHLGEDCRRHPPNGTTPLQIMLNDMKRYVNNYEKPQWPNLVIVTGDIAYKYKHYTYYEAKELFDGLAKTLELDHKQIVVLPGNHDVDLVERKDKRSSVPYTYESEFYEVLAPYAKHKIAGFPYYYDRYEDIRLVLFGFDSNILSDEIVLGLNKFKDDELYDNALRAGHIGNNQLDEFKAAFNHARRNVSDFDECVKIAILHHHVIPLPDERFKPFSILTDSGDFLDRLAKMKIDIILHGHTHKPFISGLSYNLVEYHQNIRKQILILSSGSASSKRDDPLFGNHYTIIKIDNAERVLNGLVVSVEWRVNKGNMDFQSFPRIEPFEIP